MATIESTESMYYEEKLSPTLEDSKRKEKGLENESLDSLKTKKEADENKAGKEEKSTNAELDEIAANVNAINLQDDNNECHPKYNTDTERDTERAQLVQELRILFEKYQEVNAEREYYKEVNDALLRFLKVTLEGKLEADSDEETNIDSEEKSVPRIVITPPEDEPCNVEENEDIKQQGDGIPGLTESSSSEAKTNDEVLKKKQEKPEKIKKSDVKIINLILLKHIFRLREDIEELKEHFRDYLILEDLSQSDYDSTDDDDDDHACSLCTGTQTPNEDDTSEEYEFEDNDSDKIVDESDSD